MTQPAGPQGPAAEEPAGSIPTCYRHPNRETYVRCVRCDRPICPDCMTAASVGFQCPECVREGNASVRQARTVGGGLIRGGEGVVTQALLAVLVGMFVIQFATGGLSGRVTRDLDGFGLAIAAGDWWRLISPVLLHASVIHILFNGYALYLFGPPLERWLGRTRYAALFVAAGFGGGVASYLFSPPNVAGVGASGAIFGLFGASIVLAQKLRYDLRPLFALLAINLFLGFAMSGIDWRAHLGGLAVGAFLGAVLGYAPRSLNLPAFVGALVVVLVVGVALTVVRTHDLKNSPIWGPAVQQIERGDG
jgi:membrane associated rhomboid family serine protease